MGPEDILSQAPNYAGLLVALGTPSDSEDEPVGLSDFAPYGPVGTAVARSLHDFGSGALRGAKRWPAESGVPGSSCLDPDECAV